MFFLTTVAGLPPASAGAISALGAVASAVLNPILGYISDQIYTPLGRRRPALLAFALPLAAAVMLLFTDLPLHGFIKAAYYGFMVVVFWFVYQCFFIPYNALGAVYTDDYNDRTKLRLFAAMFNGLGNMISLGVPAGLSAALIAAGLGKGHAWMAVAGALGLISAVSLLVTFAASKEKDPPCRKEHPDEKKPFRLADLFSEYIAVAKLPPVRWLVLASLANLISYTMLNADIVYYLTYCLSYPAGAVSLCLVLQTAMRTLLLIPTGKIAARIDKRYVLILFNLAAVIGFIIVRIIASPSIPAVIFFEFMVAVTTGTYWAIMPAIYYDVCDYDRLYSGKPRQGTIVSFQGLVESIATGAGSLLLGFILQLAGFDGSAAVQSATALSWIHNCATVVPAIFLVITCIAVFKYPITREAYEKIKQQLAERDAE